jgi:hypothetical protein
MRYIFPTRYQAGGVYEGSLKDPSKASQFAPAAVTMLFLFNIALVDHIPFEVVLLY